MSEEEATGALLPSEDEAEMRGRLQAHRQAAQVALADVARLEQALGGRFVSEEDFERASEALADAEGEEARAREETGAAHRALTELRERSLRWRLVTDRLGLVERFLAVARDLQGILRGGQLIDFLAEERLRQIALDASARLGSLTRYRYALELDSEGEFQVRDDHNGGERRPVSSLSGGETFLASLSLALALSAQIQLRGRFPLEFFFLDEGFGSLDPELLDTVITALERLHLEHVHIGLISHVPDLQARIPTRLLVEPAMPGAQGSRIRLERV